MTYTFKDFHHNTVKLSFDEEPFTKTPKHVWIICEYHNKWLLTEHPTRGIEFPGGKVEPGETAREAAIREVLEETGGIITELEYISQYFVDGKRECIYKNVYYGKVDQLTSSHIEHETLGPKLMDKLPADVRTNKRYSFMMKDDVLVHCLEYLKKIKKLPQL